MMPRTGDRRRADRGQDSLESRQLNRKGVARKGCVRDLDSERIRGRLKIQSSRAARPNRKGFTVRRIIGASDLWVTEFVLTYDGRPSYTGSIMEFLDGKVARETQYFGDPFEPSPSRAQWVERMP
jgi:hypothetical protein